MRGKLKYAVRALGDLLLPRLCVVCGTRLTTDERFMCSDCADDLPLTYYWDLPFNPAADRLNENIQRKIESALPVPSAEVADGDIGTEEDLYEPYARFAALFFYNSDNGYRHICHRLKYNGDIALGRHFSRMLGERLSASPLFGDVDLVVPVPLHWTRRWKRGYNQAAVIAGEVATRLGARHCPHLLVRKRRTETQTVLSVDQKKLNVAGAFTISKKAKQWRPRHILIVDDVMTTGATIAECHSALREVFPTSVRISAASLACVENR